jgi:hypothetical protein
MWNSLIFDYNTSSNMMAEIELIYNFLLSEGTQWYEYAAQPSVEYYPNNSFDLFGAVYMSSTQQADDEQTNEIRPIIGARWNIIKPEKRIFLRTQWKYEYRIFTSKTTEETLNSGRIRGRLDLFIPITRTAYNQDGDLYGIIWSEIFLNNDERIGERYQSTFRQYLGLGYRFSYNWRFEVDYVLQASRDTVLDDNADTISSVIFLTLKRFIK